MSSSPLHEGDSSLDVSTNVTPADEQSNSTLTQNPYRQSRFNDSSSSENNITQTEPVPATESELTNNASANRTPHLFTVITT